MGVDTSTVSGMAKRVYKDEDLKNLQNMSAETWPKLKKSSKKPNGSGVFGANITQGNQRGQGSQNELEALRTPANQVVNQYNIQSKVFTHTIRLSGLSLETLQGNEDSFSDNLTTQMDEGIKDATKELNAQCFRDGSGKLADVNGAVIASTSLIFDGGVPTHFREGMFIDTFDAGGVKQIDSIEITAVDVENSTVTLASAQSTDDDATVYREDTNDNAPTDGKEMAGFPRITDDGSDFATYEGIIRSGAGLINIWKGLEINASSANLSDDLLQRGRARMKVLRGTKPKRLCSNTSQERKYLATTLPSVEYNSAAKRDSDHVAELSWGGMKWVIDTDCGFDELYMFDPEYIERFDVYDLKFDDTDGNILKWDNGSDSFICYAKHYGNVGTKNPGAMLRFTSLATPTF